MPLLRTSRGGFFQVSPAPAARLAAFCEEALSARLNGDHSDTPAYLRRSVPFTAGDGFLAATDRPALIPKPSRRAVRRTEASSGEWTAAPVVSLSNGAGRTTASRSSSSLAAMHLPARPIRRPGEEAIGQLHTLRRHPGAVVSLSNGAPAETRPRPFFFRTPPVLPRTGFAPRAVEGRQR